MQIEKKKVLIYYLLISIILVVISILGHLVIYKLIDKRSTERLSISLDIEVLVIFLLVFISSLSIPLLRTNLNTNRIKRISIIFPLLVSFICFSLVLLDYSIRGIMIRSSISLIFTSFISMITLYIYITITRKYLCATNDNSDEIDQLG